MNRVLRYDDRFFNRMYGGEQIFAVGERVTELEYRDVLRGWKRLFEEPTAEFDRRLVMSARDNDGMVELRVYGIGEVTCAERLEFFKQPEGQRLVGDWDRMAAEGLEHQRDSVP